MLEPSLLTVYVEKQVNLVVMGFSVPAASVFSLDSLFIVILGLTFSQVWPYLARRKINPTLPVKFASSFLFIGFGYLLLAFLIKTTGHDTRFSVLWFLPIYFLFTMGELMIGPIGFSMVGRLAPPGREGYLMGVWQLCIGVAGAGSIIIDLFANVPEHAGLASANVIYQSLFFKLSIISFAVCAVVFLFAPKLKKLLGVSD
jgi:POT family proton-dependent oligopeptide transporter